MNIEQFSRFISENTRIPLERISPKVSLTDDLGLDSLAYVDLLLRLEDKSGIELNSIKSFDEIKTVESLFRTFAIGRE
jgi:acyl carrier protein